MSWFDSLVGGIGTGLEAVGGVASMIPGLQIPGAAMAGIGAAGTGWANFDSQQQQAQQQQSNQQVEWQREDTAVQRRAADLQAAGMNPLLAPGAPAASSVMSSAPAPQFNGDPSGVVANLMKGSQQVQALQAQADLARSQAQKTNVDTQLDQQALEFNNAANPTKIATLASQLKGQDLSNVNADIQSSILHNNVTLGNAAISSALYDNLLKGFNLYGSSTTGNALSDAAVAADGGPQAGNPLSSVGIAKTLSGLASQTQETQLGIIKDLAKTRPGLAQGLAQWLGLAVSAANSAAGVASAVSKF